MTNDVTGSCGEPSSSTLTWKSINLKTKGWRDIYINQDTGSETHGYDQIRLCRRDEKKKKDVVCVGRIWKNPELNKEEKNLIGFAGPPTSDSGW